MVAATPPFTSQIKSIKPQIGKVIRAAQAVTQTKAAKAETAVEIKSRIVVNLLEKTLLLLLFVMFAIIYYLSSLVKGYLE